MTKLKNNSKEQKGSQGMLIITAVLLGIVYWLGEANLPFVGLWTLQRPLVCGLITGMDFI